MSRVTLAKDLEAGDVIELPFDKVATVKTRKRGTSGRIYLTFEFEGGSSKATVYPDYEYAVRVPEEAPLIEQVQAVLANMIDTAASGQGDGYSELTYSQDVVRAVIRWLEHYVGDAAGDVQYAALESVIEELEGSL